MTEAFLAVEADSVKARSGGPVMANIWLTINGYEFPMRRWNDFVVVVLGWWVAALLQLLRNVSIRETVNFMDGPYAVEVSKLPSGMLQFRALEGRGRDSEVAIGEGLATPFVLGLISHSREVLEVCRQQSWWSKDAEILESSLEILEQESRKRLS